MKLTISPSHSHLITTQAGNIEVAEYGPADGPVFVFLHGIMANHRLWEQVIEPVSKQARVLLPTLPLGSHKVTMSAKADLSPKSMVSLIIELLDSLEIDKVTFVGNDSGGALCQMLMAEHPDRINSVILTTCDAYDVWLPWMFKSMELMALIPGGMFILAQILRFQFVRRLPIGFGWIAKRMPNDVQEAFVRPMISSRGVRRDMAKFLRGLSPKLTTSAAKHFNNFDKPVLILWSKNDPLFPDRLADRLLKDLPQAKLEFIDDSYVFSPIDQPEIIADRILSHFHETAAA